MSAVKNSSFVDAPLEYMVDHLVLDEWLEAYVGAPHRDPVRVFYDAALTNQEHVIGLEPDNRIEVSRPTKAGFNLGIPPRIFGGNRIKQPKVLVLNVEAKDATRGEQDTKCERGAMHYENIGAVRL